MEGLSVYAFLTDAEVVMLSIPECLCMCTAVGAMTNRHVNASHHSDKRVSSAHQHEHQKGHNHTHVNTRYKDVKVGSELDST